jgi:uncharacterized membrane protein YhaH (DUF805 family)
MLRTMRETFWLFALLLIALFAFFLALGAFKPGEMQELTIAMGILVAAWIVHAQLEHRSSERDQAAIRARERRGF